MSKKNIILAIILIILVGGAWAYNGPYKDWKINKNKPKNFLTGVEFSQVGKIEIIKAGQTTILERSGEKWKISGTKDFYVPDEIAKTMPDAFSVAQKSDLELVSQNKDKKSEFSTDNESGQEMKLYKGDKAILDFIIGRPGADYVSSYISEANSDKTYLVKTSLYSAFVREDWYDKTMFAADKTKANKIRFQISGAEFTVEKKVDKWQGVKPKSFPVDNAKIEEAVNTMSSLTAAEIPEQKFAGTGLGKDSAIIQITGEGIDNTLMIGGSNGKDLFYAKKGNSDNIYLITKEQKTILTRKMEELK